MIVFVEIREHLCLYFWEPNLVHRPAWIGDGGSIQSDLSCDKIKGSGSFSSPALDGFASPAARIVGGVAVAGATGYWPGVVAGVICAGIGAGYAHYRYLEQGPYIPPTIDRGP